MVKSISVQVTDDCWPFKIHSQKSNANANEVDSLLAQAEYIMRNPDEFLETEEHAELV